jgi:hypothetical protein
MARPGLLTVCPCQALEARRGDLRHRYFKLLRMTLARRYAVSSAHRLCYVMPYAVKPIARPNGVARLA